MAEVAAAGVVLGIPIVGQLQQRCTIVPGTLNISGGCQKHQGKTTLFVVVALDFDQSQLTTIEIQGLFQVTYPGHGMKVLYAGFLKLFDG